MKKSTISVMPLYLWAFLLLCSCSSDNGIRWCLDTEQLWAEYTAAVKDAAVALPSEISNSLVAITKPGDEPRMEWLITENENWVLVGSMMQSDKAQSFNVGATIVATDDITWVTVPFDFEEHLRADPTICSDSLECHIRLQQMLGMPPNSSSDCIVFFYVKSSRLWRPSPDPEVDDTTASLSFEADVPEHYRNWFNENIEFSYKSSTPYPWTRLGYTYDWHSGAQSVVGPSEFIVHPGAEMKVKQKVGIWTWYKGLFE